MLSDFLGGSRDEVTEAYAAASPAKYINTGDAPMKFLCMIPNSATDKKVTVVPECEVRKG